MRIDRMELQNFRGFEHFEIDLDPRLTVIAGVNGSGKTSVLEGLAVAAGAWLLGFDGIVPRNIKRDDVRLAVRTTGTLATGEPQFPTRVAAIGDIGGPTAWAREVRKKGGRTTHGETAEIRERAQIASEAIRSGAHVDLPVIAYYGAGRLWKQHKESEKKTRGLVSRTQGYVDCLEPASNHKLFESWMRQLELVRLQRISDRFKRTGVAAITGHDIMDPVGEAVRTLVEGATLFVYDMAAESLVLSMSDGSERRFETLSDGYRNLVSMAGDLAWRAAQLNPHREAHAPGTVSGVVLIDEIELHLHPKWQRQVLRGLMEAFPLVQFIVTTHSPIVLGSVPPRHVRLIDGERGPVAVSTAQGLTVNDILRTLMGVPARDDATSTELKRLAGLIEGGNRTEARALFEELHDRLGDTDDELGVLHWELLDLEAGDA